MNIYAYIIVMTLLLDYILNLIADLLNLNALKDELPDEFKDIYDAEAYRKSQVYTRVKTRFGFLADTLDIIVLLGFWFFGGFNKLDHIVRSWGWGEITTGLCYVGILVLLKTIISLPFSIYGTFVIEDRFGFNKTTGRTFALDFCKAILLTIALGGPLLAGLQAFFLHGGEYAWLYGWIALTSFMLFIQYIAPIWILPLFNKFTPLQDGELKEKILAYTHRVHFPVHGVYVIDGSRRSTKSNAFFTGFGKNKRIALFDTLIANHSASELVSILAHEIGHYKKQHILYHMVIAVLHSGIMFYLLSIFLNHPGLFHAFYMDSTSVYAGLIFFSMLYSPIELILSIFLQMISRLYEYQADYFAVTTVEDKQSMIDALKKLTRHNLSNLTPHPFYVFLHYSHPPTLQRIQALRQVDNHITMEQTSS